MIDFSAKGKTFHLKGRRSSFLIGISSVGEIYDLHWGAALKSSDFSPLLERWRALRREEKPEALNRDFASFGRGDLRSPAFLIRQADGSRYSNFRYQGHQVLAGKAPFEGPQSYVQDPREASTLRLMFADTGSGQLLDHFITLYPEDDILLRRSVLRQGSQGGDLLRFMSCSMDLPAASWWATSLPGDWARERMVQAAPLRQGILRLESRRGSQSHQMSPFMALSQGEAQEESGELWALALLYSGNWLIESELEPSGRLRLNAGLNDFDFNWRLEPGEQLVGPEVLLAWSEEGLGGLSRRLHRFGRKRLSRGPWRDAARPVLANSWEGHYFKFKEQDIVKMGEQAKDLGVELLVLDDGWFGKRDDDTSSLGDWQDDMSKLPEGVAGLSKKIHEMGLKFGLWFEPEGISPHSLLYQMHPDWAYAVPGREIIPWRHQYVLDLTRPEVCDYLFERLSHYIVEAELDYIKWDMNRPLWDMGSSYWPPERQAELPHRHMMATYGLLERLRQAFPALLLEGCAGGGGRFDLGMLCYTDQIWTSDNTDPYDRLLIQHGSSYFLSPLSMGAHLSASPNHQTQRATPLLFRAHVAMAANFGLELNLSKLLLRERREISEAIRQYKEIRHLVHEGDFYRLEDPFRGPRCAWAFVAPKQDEAAIFIFQKSASPVGMALRPVLLRGLDPLQEYELMGQHERHSGAFLMSQGILPRLGAGDFQSQILRLRAH